MIKQLSEEFNVLETHIQNIIVLIEEGNTIPFIARYRKELTGSMDDQTLRELSERMTYLRNLDEKKTSYMQTIEEQGKLTEELKEEILSATTLAVLEDLYRPYRPKRRTRATMAEEKGLLPLAEEIWLQDGQMDIKEMAKSFVNTEKEVETVEEAIQGALDILAERMSDDADNRGELRELFEKEGIVTSTGTDIEDKEMSVYQMYFDFQEPVKQIVGHRILAINRGEKEKALKISIEVPEEKAINKMIKRFVKDTPYTKEYMILTVNDAYQRLIFPSVEREIRNQLTEEAETGAIEIFSENLRQLLLQPPLRNQVVLAIDPAFRTGCKVGVIDGYGKVLDTTVIFPTAPRNDIEGATKTLVSMIKKYNVDVIAIGNGTASRETEKFVADVLQAYKQEFDKTIHYIIVNEAGASVYSASKLAAEEFPDFDVGERSAASIGRRLQDPLAELVKIDPKSIGVGQYQHDMNQKRLDEALFGVVESCVNTVGVDINTASAPLLSYVAGISSRVAKNILLQRETAGAFTSRDELKEVKQLGAKTFEQCAGFLRVPNSTYPLDNTGVHPESYKITEELLAFAGISMEELGKPISKERFGNLKTVSKALDVGLPTLEDIVLELEKPGRDPRDEKEAPLLRSDVLEMEDLEVGMLLSGTVRNITDFGAFVDIGVHQDGLVHISELSDAYIKHPLDVVSVGEIVAVRVLNVDVERKRISLSMKKES